MSTATVEKNRRIHTQYLFALTQECKKLGWEPGDKIVAEIENDVIVITNSVSTSVLAERLMSIREAESAKMAEIESAKKAKETEKARKIAEKEATEKAAKEEKEMVKAAKAETAAKKAAEEKAKKQPSEPKTKTAPAVKPVVPAVKPKPAYPQTY